MDKKHVGLPPNEGKNESKFLFWAMALIPAICTAITYLYGWLPLPYNLNMLVHSGINILDVMHSMPYLGKST